MFNLNKKLDEIVKDFNNKKAVRNGVLSLLNNPDFLRLHPEARLNKNKILREIDKNIKTQKERTNNLKMFMFLKRIASDIIGEKANKLVKLQDYLKKEDIPFSLKAKIEKIKETMTNSVMEAYRMLKEAEESGDENRLKTAIVSILMFSAKTEEDKNLTIFIFKDINKESGIDFKKAEEFFEKNKELIKIDNYIEEFEKLISSRKRERTKTKSSDISI